MITLIGDGGHATDIAAVTVFWSQVNHHEDFKGQGAYILGINDCAARAKIAVDIGYDDEAWIHPSTHIGPGCSWGAGTHINYGVSMTRTAIGRHCTISPGATICGDVTIGDRVLIGAGAVVCDRVTIGDGAVVGAGAVILPGRTIASGAVVMGVPAR